MKIYLRKILLNIKKNKQDDILLGKLIGAILSYDEDLNYLNYAVFSSLLKKDLPSNIFEEEKEDAWHDYRIRYLGFQNFRAFPDNKEYPYSLSFKNQLDEVSSLYLVGRNSTGKSTIFSALEFLYTHKVSNADLKDITNKNSYLTFGLNQIDQSGVKKAALLVDKSDKYEEKLLELDQMQDTYPSAFFCSEYDINIIGKAKKNKKGEKQEDYFDYIFTQLGFDELSILKDRLVYILNRFDEKRKQNKSLTPQDIKEILNALVLLISNDSQDNIEQNLKDYSNAEKLESFLDIHKNENNPILKQIFLKRWNNLISNVSLESKIENRPGIPVEIFNKNVNYNKTIDNPSNSLYEVLKEMYKQLLDYYSRFKKEEREKVFVELINNLERSSEDNEIGSSISEEELKLIPHKIPILLDELKKRQENLMKEFNKKLAPFIIKTLSSFSENYEIFYRNPENDSFVIKIKVCDKNGNELFEATPAEYLNSFRYRLFAVSLKIALSFYFMRSNKCLLPIVIDDVFNASDFENTINIESFVNRIYETYQKFVRCKQSLQLIMLTHDEMVLEGFRNGTKIHSKYIIGHIKKNGMEDPATHFRCGRLFPYWEAEKIHKMIASSRKYYELYMKL